MIDIFDILLSIVELSSSNLWVKLEKVRVMGMSVLLHNTYSHLRLKGIGLLLILVFVQACHHKTNTEQEIQVVRNVAGEADPSIMTLSMKTWYWENTQYNNDTLHKPKSPKVFSLKFEKNGTLLIGTDCNTMRGEYNITDNQIAFSKMLSTRMYCKDSQEQVFAKMLNNVSSYFFTSKGRLVLELKYDSGAMMFW